VRFSGPFSEPTYFFATGRATTTCLRVFKAGEKASEGKSAFAMYSFFLPAMIAGAFFWAGCRNDLRAQSHSVTSRVGHSLLVFLQSDA